MLTVITWLVVVFAFFTLAFYRAGIALWFFVLFVLSLLFFFLHLWAVSFFLLFFLFLLLIFLIPAFRLNVWSKPFMRWFGKKQPPLTAVERQVLEAGGVWWEKQLFQGKPHWQQLFNIGVPTLSDREQLFIDNQVENLCALLNDWQVTTELYDLTAEVWQYIKKEKFWGLIIPTEYDGHGFSALAHSTIISKIASRCVSAAMTVMVPNSLGPAEFLLGFGTEQQKKYYLPRLARGEEVSCFALTSTFSGSDAASIQDKGVVARGEYAGKEIIGIRLNFSKRYITLAPIATLIGLAFRLYDPEHLLGEQEDIGITAAIVPSDCPGITLGERHLPLNLAFMNGPLLGEDVFIPLDFIIGGAELRGQGWQMLMNCLAVGRGISLPSLSSAAAKVSFRMSSAYARIRQQFKQPIGDFEGVAALLGRIGGINYLCEAVRLFNALAVDNNAHPAVASAIAKYHLTECARKAVNDAMDIHAGRAIQNGPRNYLASLYNTLPITVSVEGANILTRCLIIYGQGVVRCHPYLMQEMELIKDENSKQATLAFDRLLGSHIRYTLYCFVRTLGYGLSAGLWMHVPFAGHSIYKYICQLTRMSFAFNFLSEMTLMLLGAKLKRREFLSARFSDILSYLYIASAVLKHHYDENFNQQSRPFAEWALSYCLYQIQEAINNIITNYPKKWLGKLLKKIIFPWGNSYTAPNDKLLKSMAQAMQYDIQLRDRLSPYCYYNLDLDDVTGRVEKTFLDLNVIQDSLDQLIKQLKNSPVANSSLREQIQYAKQHVLLNENELQALSQYAEQLSDVLAVDNFIIKGKEHHVTNRADRKE